MKEPYQDAKCKGRQTSAKAHFCSLLRRNLDNSRQLTKRAIDIR